MTRFLGAIDQGTSSTRFIVFDPSGTPVASAQREHRRILPRPGWVEHDAREILRNAIEVSSEALAKAGLAAKDLAAVGIANQRETTVVWDRRTGEPLHHAIVWQDNRADPLVAEYARRGVAALVRERTGLPLASYFSAVKLRWLLDGVPRLAALGERGEALFGTIDSWLLWNLTGGPRGGLHRTDATNASRTQLMNLETLDWDAQLLELFDIPRAMLPCIGASSALHGEARVAELDGAPLAGILGDQQAALLGEACVRSGDAKATYGTGGFVLLNTGERRIASSAGLITTVAYKLGDASPCYALEGSIAVAGSLVQWLRDNLGLVAQSSEIEALARRAADNGGVYFVPAFSGLYAPYWNPGARGLIVGLSHDTDRAHLARAALEATAFQMYDVLEVMARESGAPIRELRVDGGMVVNEMLMQFQADLLGATVARPRVIETTALGAAYAAGLAVGALSGIEELARNWQAERRWIASMDPARRESLLHGWRKAVERSLDWAEQRPEPVRSAGRRV